MLVFINCRTYLFRIGAEVLLWGCWRRQWLQVSWRQSGCRFWSWLSCVGSHQFAIFCYSNRQQIGRVINYCCCSVGVTSYTPLIELRIDVAWCSITLILKDCQKCRFYMYMTSYVLGCFSPLPPIWLHNIFSFV